MTTGPRRERSGDFATILQRSGNASQVQRLTLAIGRIISLIVDGMPSPMLLFYLVVELVVGTWGLFVLSRERRNTAL